MQTLNQKLAFKNYCAKQNIVIAMVAGMMAQGVCKMVAILNIKDYTDFSLDEINKICKDL